MAFTPRGSEVAAVVAVLESDEFDDAKAMAQAIVRALAKELTLRETYVIVPPDAPFGYGPYWSQKDAEKAWETEIGSSFGRRGRLLRAFPWTEQDELNASCECSHQKENHVIPGPKNKPGKPSECGRTGCPCKSYTPRKVAA